MEPKLRHAFKGWLKEAGLLYLLVALFVGLCFLGRNAQSSLSCNATLAKRPALEGPPLSYGRTQ